MEKLKKCLQLHLGNLLSSTIAEKCLTSFKMHRCVMLRIAEFAQCSPQEPSQMPLAEATPATSTLKD